uniref:Odorant receptor n=1 Tax=Holotrichia parallela TaxID=93412 RepID=A0A2P0ZPI4_HOLPA|nr:odorant receptor 7 [Holotrichia parallela]
MRWFKYDREILKDKSKYTMVVSQILLNIINFWPEKYSFATKISFIIMFLTCATMETSLVIYLLTSIEDVTSFTKVISSAAVVMQCMTKMCIVFFNSKKLNVIIKTVWYEFWPSNMMGAITEENIRSDSKILLVGFLIEYGLGCVFLLLFIIAPAMTGIRQLPYNAWYPFEWSTTPTYEILYVLQVYIDIYIIANTVCGYDFLYGSICVNCIAQFRLLNEAIKKIGTGKEAELTSLLLETPGVNYRPIFNKEYEKERRLLVICIQHHQKLINICYQLNKIFTYGHFVQLSASVMAICMSCYLITTESSANELSFLTSYYIAHVSQLLVLCAISNEVTHWSSSLSITAYECAWYNNKYTDIRKCLSIVIMRSQKPLSMQALGLFELSYASFLGIMRFTFSLYTFLGKMAN